MPAGIDKQDTRLLAPGVRRPLVLWVDESAGDCDCFSRLLRDNGYDVWISSNYDDGVRCLGGRPFDCVVVDQGSPAFEGRLILEYSVALDRRLPVIVITRFHDMGCYLEAMQLGAVDYLEKPQAAAEIIRVLKTHLPSRYLAA
ncbi:MAG TPA: response regulator [Terriglobia bacterium]|nr:response regulator [Terriglobia bacterium]